MEESARFTAPIPSANLTNHQMMNHVGLNTIQNGGNMSFSGGFGQEFGGLESENGQLNLEWQQKSRLIPLWLDNAQLNGIGNPSSSATSSRANFLMTDQELAQLASQNHQWVSGVLKEEDEGEENKRHLSESISSSLYYSQINHEQQTNSPAPMSATALLQKAAQIGSLNSFSRSRNNNNIDDGKDQNSSKNLVHEGESSLTRDFLGVGGKEKYRDNLFASMSSSSAMEMRRYSRND